MLRITESTSASGAKAYYTEGLSREDYYSEGHEIVGHWGGKAAALLGLKGPVDRDAFFALWGSKPEPPKIPSADQRGLSRARSMG